MGIAVSLFVRPSRCLRWLQAGMALSVIIAPLAAWPPDAPLVWLAVLAGFVALCHPPLALRNGKGCRLDISNNGAIRLAVYLNHSPCAAMPAPMPLQMPARLLPGAVLWPWLLVLPLRLDDGRTVRLLVLPDSVAPGAFRSLSVACRACAARDL
ncbi:hypothetical protein GCM10027277_37800 [Pseudoduganella ginsengisoli]|uniref:Flagellar hook-length control protein n=1 Tax=Pseudoduganella ginsengisoli TaxID=1462440 RepID=A0A6L6PZ02_9BURK|nr:protein YgfX [Pseudoduganella ginsengisoli]MTW02399.1 flagellar hook-length control protein [Pseudoduganella ginsengisoli]